MNQFRPSNFMLLPTMSCQGRCVYCFGPNKGPVMDAGTADRTAAFIYRIAPKDKRVHITFHGGEPLLAPVSWYRRLLPKLRELFGLRLQLSVQSNLLALSDEMLELIEEYGISVGTSVDGYPEMCDAQRGAGYYETNAAAQARLAERGVSSGSICTFTPDYTDRASVERVFRSFRWPFAVHGSVPGLGDPPAEHHLSVEQMKTLLLNCYEVYRENLSVNRITTVDSMARGCFTEKGAVCTFFDCLGVFAAIAADGGVYSCQRFCGHTEYCFGNVNDDLTEEQILRSEGYRRLCAQREGAKDACAGCRHYGYCNGGCLYSAVAAKGAKDPYCEAYREVFDRLSLDMAKEMASVLTGGTGETPALSMAGDRPHPYERCVDRERMEKYIASGRSGEPCAVRRPGDRHPENNLNKLYLHLTFNCPLRCPHCYADGGVRKTEELSAERFAAIIREAADRRFRSVVLTGGEPLVYREFDKLCGLLGGVDLKGTRLILRSSFGFEIPEERLKAVCGLFDEIVVSIDGDEQSHDARRGPGRYRLAADNLKKAAALGFAEKLGITATLYRENEEDIEAAVYALADTLGISRVRIRPVLPLGRGEGAEQAQYTLCSEETDFSAGFRPKFTCGLGQNLYVEPDGRAFPCYAWCAEERLLGNLREESLGCLLDRGGLYEYCRHTVDTNEKCRSCEVRYLCGGICKAWVKDKSNVDSGEFDCTARKQYFLRIAERTERT